MIDENKEDQEENYFKLNWMDKALKIPIEEKNEGRTEFVLLGITLIVIVLFLFGGLLI